MMFLKIKLGNLHN